MCVALHSSACLAYAFSSCVVSIIICYVCGVHILFDNCCLSYCAATLPYVWVAARICQRSQQKVAVGSCQIK
jgi:hypothetical protein